MPVANEAHPDRLPGLPRSKGHPAVLLLVVSVEPVEVAGCRAVPHGVGHRYLVGGSRGEGHGEVHLALVVGVAPLGLGISNAQCWRRGWCGLGRCWQLWGLGRGRWGRLLHWRLAWAACCITRSEEGQGEGPRSGIEGGGLDGVGAGLQGAPDAGVVPPATVVVIDGLPLRCWAPVRR